MPTLHIPLALYLRKLKYCLCVCFQLRQTFLPITQSCSNLWKNNSQSILLSPESTIGGMYTDLELFKIEVKIAFFKSIHRSDFSQLEIVSKNYQSPKIKIKKANGCFKSTKKFKK